MKLISILEDVSNWRLNDMLLQERVAEPTLTDLRPAQAEEKIKSLILNLIGEDEGTEDDKLRGKLREAVKEL